MSFKKGDLVKINGTKDNPNTGVIVGVHPEPFGGTPLFVVYLTRRKCKMDFLGSEMTRLNKT